MCHQSVGLIQSIIERTGIPTASVTLLREITERRVPPRALFVDFPLGYGDAFLMRDPESRLTPIELASL